jgi:WxL domain surface cell wall-binding
MRPRRCEPLREHPGLWLVTHHRAIRRPSCLRLLAVTAAVAGCLAGWLAIRTTPALAGTLGGATWEVSDTAPAATGVRYSYGFTTASTGTLGAITMSVPQGTAGTPAAGTVTPPALTSGATVSRSGTTLTYSFAPVSVSAGTAVSIEVTGLRNTDSAGSYSSDITTRDGGSVIDTGSTGPVDFRGTLTDARWSVSDARPASSAVTYTYRFTTASTAFVDTVTMTVPDGTAGTPAVGTISPSALAAGASVRRSGNTLTYTCTGATISAGTAVTIEITGLTNADASGSYASAVTTSDGGQAADTGTTDAVSFSGSLTLTSPHSLAWSATLTGQDLEVVATDPAAQELVVDDSTGSGAGWRLSVSATTFTGSNGALPDAGVLTLTGSTGTVSSAGPSASCLGSCGLPDDTTTYPVSISTASTAPASYTIYEAAASTGSGKIAIGGSGAVHPIGWWIRLPASAYAGIYSSTITISLVSAP